MLVRITEKCRMGCSHCLANATPEGRHMNESTFRDALYTAIRYGRGIIMISGGEPTEHPQFLEYVRYARLNRAYVIILSNGMFLADPVKREEIFALECPIQITNDPRYYPSRIPHYDHPLISYERELRTLVPLGRARGMNPIGRKGPSCFNLRSLVRRLVSDGASEAFGMAIDYLRTMGKLCTPSINVDGTVVAGETPECCQIGTVTSTENEFISNILSMKCNRCTLENGLTDPQRAAINA